MDTELHNANVQEENELLNFENVEYTPCVMDTELHNTKFQACPEENEQVNLENVDFETSNSDYMVIEIDENLHRKIDAGLQIIKQTVNDQADKCKNGNSCIENDNSCIENIYYTPCFENTDSNYENIDESHANTTERTIKQEMEARRKRLGNLHSCFTTNDKTSDLTNKTENIDFEDGNCNPKNLRTDSENKYAEIDFRYLKSKNESITCSNEKSGTLLTHSDSDLPPDWNTATQPFKCNLCGKEFKTSHILTRHMLTHGTERPHLCNMCDKGFKRVDDLRQHMSVHSLEQPHVCKVCDKAFKCLRSLRMHKASHSSERLPYQCNLCDKEFMTSHILRRHMSYHSTERPHQCDICDKGFKDLFTLRKHIITHTNERPHQCSMCDKTFKRAQALRRHMAVHSLAS